MKQADYLENEWPEDVREEIEAETEDPESDRGLYTYDTAPSEEETEDKKVYSEETDFLNAEDYSFLPFEEHRMYKLKKPPELPPNTTRYEMAEFCFRTYYEKHNLFYYYGFLHYVEPTLNRIATGFMLRYSMVGHFTDLKQEAVLGLLEAEQHYDPTKGRRFLEYSRDYMKNRMHDYIRKMRRGCTVESDYADKKLRTAMKLFYEYGGRNDLETIRKVAEEMKIPQEDATEMIGYALLNTLCTGMNRQLGSADGETEESREERTVSPYPEPHEAFLEKCRTQALCAAWNSLNYREQEILAAHLGFCPDCFGVLERTGHSEKWYDCVPRKKFPYEDIAISHSLSSPESARRICEKALEKMRNKYFTTFQDSISLKL